MNVGRRGDRGRRAVVTTAVLTAGLAASAVLAWASAGVAAAVRAPGPAPLDSGLGLAAAVAAWLVLSWLVLASLLALATTASPRASARLERFADRVTPAVVRRATAALLGTGLAGASLAGGCPAYADSPAPPPPPAATSSAAPAIDRPAGLLPGWTPDRPAPPPPPPTTAPSRVHLVTSPAHPGRSLADEVVVRRGDTLWDIAARHLGSDATAADVATEWPRWHRANRDLIGPRPDLILPGQRLRPPGR